MARLLESVEVFQPAPAKAGEGADVLLVENDDSVRRCIAEMMGDAGLRVAEAASASEALAIMLPASTPAAVLVADLNLGWGMDGAELIAALSGRVPSLRAVLISAGEVTQEKLDRCDAFLPKPFHGDDLIRTIKAVRGRQPGPGDRPAALH